MIRSASGPSRPPTPLVQEIILPETTEPGYDVAIPVIVPGSCEEMGHDPSRVFPEACL